MLRRMLLCLVTTFWALGCQDQPTSPPLQEPPDRLASGLWGGLPAFRDLDDQIAEFGRSLPGGFGGMFWDEEGKANVYLLDQTRRGEVVEILLGRQRVSPGAKRLTASDIRIIDGHYEFATLLGWYRAFLASPESAFLLVGDVDDRWNRIRIEVSDPANVAKVTAAMRRLAIPEDAFVVLVSPPIFGETTLRARIRPVEGGIQGAADLRM